MIPPNAQDVAEDPLITFLLDRLTEQGVRAMMRSTPASEAVRIMRAMETTRQLLDEHMDNGGYVRGPGGVLVRSGPRGERCLTCVDPTTLYCGAPTDFSAMAEWPCRTVRLLALPYAEHGDYRQEWAPAAVEQGEGSP